MIGCIEQLLPMMTMVIGGGVDVNMLLSPPVRIGDVLVALKLIMGPVVHASSNY